MYLEFYNLREKPFSLTPDPSFLFFSNAHRRAIAFLKYGLQESKGFLQLTGPVGSGKTTLLRAVLAELDEKTKTAYIINPCASFPDLLRSIMKDLEIPNIPNTRLKIELLDFFHDYLLVQTRRSQPVIVIFDEAQNLSIKNLEEVRMLSNFETSKNKLLQIVFVGQPEFVKTLDLPELRQLKQRIQVRYHLSPLRQPEIKAYIDHRLRVAGSNGDIVFTDAACESIYNFSDGIPRLINSVCDVMLLIGYVNERKQFDSDEVREAISEMNGSFSEEPSDTSEDARPLKTEEPAESPRAETNEHSDNVPPSLYESTGDSRPTDSDDNHEDVLPPLPSGEPDSDLPTAQTSIHTTAPEPESVDDQATESPDPGDFNKKQPGFQSVPEESKTTSHRCLSPLPYHASFDASRIPTPRLFRYGTKGKFCAGGRGMNKLVERGKTIPGRIAELFAGWASVKNGHSSQVTTCENNIMADAVTEQDPHVSTDEQKGCTHYVNEEPQLDTLDEQDDDHSQKVSQKLTDSPVRPRPLKQSPRLPTGLVNSKIMILFKDGTIKSGIAKDLNFKLDGFSFLPYDSAREAQEEYCAFEKIIAVRLVDSFDEGWEKNREPSRHKPKGRRIIVTLSNGEITEGITLSKFDPKCQRFFIISAHDDGRAVWTLVERSGTSGIFTDGFREGIYLDEKGQADSTTQSETNLDDPGWQYETAGDLCFSTRDYDSALFEYQKAWEVTSNVKRIYLKISLTHFERGLIYMSSNEYGDAMKEFERVVASGYLREKARRKVKQIKKMLRNNNSFDERR